MASKQSKGQSQDYVFLECDCDHSFEKTPDNSKWINRIDGGLVLPENSILSVQYAGINIRGSGQDVIEFKNEKIGESEFYEYNETTQSYDKNKYDVFDNKVTTFLEFYKNQDGLYTFNLPYPYFDYDSDTYNTDWSSLNNSKNTTTEEIQSGLTSTNYKSIYNFAFPIDNKRYTILKRNPNSIYTGSGNGRTEGTLQYDRTISRYEYSIYQNKVELEVDKGFVSPSSVAEQVSQQLQKHTKPKIKTMTCWSNSALPTDDIVWHDSKEVQSGLTCETETFKLFKSATRRTFYKGSYNAFNNENATLPNNNAEVQYYQDNYEYIGCYNPEFFLYGRSMLYDATYDGFQKTFVFLNEITCALLTTPQFVEHDMYLNIPYNEATLGQYINLFKIQIQDSELWQNNVAIDTNSTPDNSVFLHVSCAELPFPNLNDFKTEPFGSDNPSADIFLTNPLYLTRDTNINSYTDSNAFGVFYPWRANDGKFYTMVKGRFYVAINPANPSAIPPTPANPYFKYYRDKDLRKSTYGGTFIETKEHYVDSNFPLALQKYNRIGFDRHFSAQGNQCILLWNGLGATSNLEVGLLHKDKTNTTPDATAVFSNSFVETGHETETGATLREHTYYYDTGNDEIYIGADSFLFNFDDTEARFNLSNCHTARKQFNTALSGYDASILTGVDDDATGNPDIYYKAEQISSTTDNVKFPLEINGNANQAIYEVSPTTLITHTQEVYDNEIVLKENTIFDSNCGIFFSNFGISEETFENSLWNVLGFSLQQTKTYMTEELGNQIPLNRNYRFLNLGVNLNDAPVYPFTTNANINSNEIISWKTNPFSISYFNTLGIPNPFRVVQHSTANPHIPWVFDVKASPYRIVQNQTSTFITADVLPSKTNIPFYQVRSDILPILKYYGGDEQSNGRLPVLAIVNKSSPSADFMVNQGDNSMSFIIKKRTILNTVTTEIFDNYGRPAILDEHSSVIYKIEVPYNEPLLTQFNTLGEFEEAEQLQQKKKK